MLFNSLSFVIFFIVVFTAYRALGRSLRGQNWLLLGAGYLFYGWWDVRFVHLLVISTCLDFSCGLVVRHGRLTSAQAKGVLTLLIGSAFGFLVLDWKGFRNPGHSLVTHSPLMLAAAGSTVALAGLAALGIHALGRLEEQRRRRLAIVVSIAGNLTLLGFFKYFNFFAGSLTAALSGVGIAVDAVTLHVILPVGISFYTFQSMAYAIDVYRSELEPAEDLVEFASFVVFFPQLEAGPISRAKNLLPQFQKPRAKPSREQVSEAIWLIGWGLYKKMVVADNVAPLVNSAFGPFDHGGPLETPRDGLRLLFALYGFALQIYGDFSGYTDIARGAAKLLGFELTINFNLPYFAVSPSDFWRRWHISLSTWLRDYLYVSLGGNRGGVSRTYRNLFLTMLLGGLWHGASWTFVVWGAYHGLILIAYRLFLKGDDRDRPRLVNLALGVFMFQLTCIGWLLFRARNLGTVRVFFEAIFTHPAWSPEAGALLGALVSHGWFLVAFQVLQYASKTLHPMPKLHWFLRLNVWLFIVMSLITLSGHSQEFIYFDF